nr:DUF3352 domain-containing protein [Cytophagales bacterium]
FLVEDVIRRADAGGSQWPDWRAVDKVKIGENPPVTLYVNPKALPGLVQVFTGNAADAGVLGNFGQFSDLAVSQKDNRLVLSGQTHTDQTAAAYLSVFEGQRPQPVSCLSLVPSETAVLYRWSFSDAAAFLRSQHRYDSARGLAEGDFPRPNPLWMGREIALAIVETASDQPDQLLCVQATDFTKAVRQVESVAPGTFSENYAGATIRQATGAEFPARFFGSVFNGFPECYYAIVGQHLVFGNSVQALKNLLDRRAAGEVWSKSARYQQLVSQKPACFGVYVNPSRAWALFLQRASPPWRKWMQQYANELKDIEAVALGVGAGKDGAFATEMALVRREKATAAALLNRFFVTWRTTADTTLTMPPVLVRNHNDGSREMLTQDAAHRLYLFSQSGKILWRRPLENAVQSAVHQVDYLKNNKLQYLFATRTHLQLIDRNGNTVAPYPMRVPTAAALHTLTVVDYDSNRDYRFLVSDLLGNLYMYDKAGNALEGWNPLRTGYRLQCAPRHVRIRDKDYFVVLQANGRLLLLNRRGQPYPGFPVDLKTRTDTPFFLETALSPEETHVVVVSREGEVIRVNFSGETVSRRQLVRTSGKCVFRLCAEPQGRDWVVGRLDSRTLGILDKNGNLLWETADVPSDNPYLQYYNFGGGRRLMAVTAAGRTSVHTFDGKIVGDESFANRLPLAVVYADAYDKMLLYHTDGRKAGVLSVKIK